MSAGARPLLLCFDGSPDAAEAIRRAGALMPGREALVLSVAIPAEAGFPLEPLGEIVGRLSGVYDEWDEIAAEVAERHAQAGCALALAVGLQARPLTAIGKPAAAILRVAAEYDVGLIVLAPVRHGPLDGLLGGVTMRVVQQADHPVLLIPRSR